MKIISTFLVSLLLFTSSAFAQVTTIIINKQSYEFAQPIRLNSVLSIVAEAGDWYWPASGIYNLNDAYAEREKDAVLSDIRIVMKGYSADSDTYQALENLYQQISSWTVSTRVITPISYNRARLIADENPMFQPGRYLLRISPRPSVVHFSGLVLKPGAYEHSSDLSIFSVVKSVTKAPDADKSHVFVVTPTGDIEKRGIAYWNLDYSQLMPGSQVYVPITGQIFSSALDELNTRIANLAVHRILPQ
ncbi:capsule biosynthesis GfcC family protein [Alteromonas sp. 1_MG-2023]|uniref:capsule biosynthesis GfcC family protein n=1 Tax=Alteromonas sp. 1_MG-2023 TaxID=3062669 RepID=UPI0026E1965F|nr:capsule biosynthesis GfcC family protein [Alteromonas sp. 1_MG-2023]MDO6566463.1 capsule biosynthesis GfcC family protein [Alteromonas sp. 1_MG-2023]